VFHWAPEIVAVELYFDDLERAKRFYIGTMGLDVSDEQVGHHTRFDGGAGFVCIERKGAESYPSKDNYESKQHRDNVKAVTGSRTQ